MGNNKLPEKLSDEQLIDCCDAYAMNKLFELFPDVKEEDEFYEEGNGGTLYLKEEYEDAYLNFYIDKHDELREEEEEHAQRIRRTSKGCNENRKTISN